MDELLKKSWFLTELIFCITEYYILMVFIFYIIDNS